MIVSDVVINFFKKIGVEHIFTVVGGGSIFLCDSLRKDNKINNNLVIIRDNQTKSNINIHELKNAYNNIKIIIGDL